MLAVDDKGLAYFVKSMSDRYPELYAHLFDVINPNVGVLDLIERHKIEPTKYHYTSYEDVYNYIVENEDKHDWWML